MKKFFTILAIIVAFVVILFVFNSRTSQAPVSPYSSSQATAKPSTPPFLESPQNNITKTYQIRLDPANVSPKNLEIKVGDTITFTSYDKMLHWPASGTHPTHQLCPGFDALRGLKQGESYSYTFTKSALCPFHDHLHAGNPQFQGQININ